MIENMFVGRPPGNYDRLLDFSGAVTGNLFFVPSATFLEDLNDAATPDEISSIAEPPSIGERSPQASVSSADEISSPAPPARDGSLGIGSLKGDIQHE
jgi:porphyrinogen peroxidase